MNRWRLHRGGIVNIWQYGEQVFDFSGGRAIFQGTNGSGKSRTLELLLPLCLDGDLRQVGSKGFDTVSVRRLMLDDHGGASTNRIGYAWVELTRGTDEYLTCGIGVKASKTSQAITDSWRFVTSERIGHDFFLVAEQTPLGPAQLRDLLGADRVLDEAAFREKVAEVVYGVPVARYGDLLHLQRTLRNPDVGLKVLEGQLEQILSDALPPLDPALVERLATSFDDLESIRENIARLSSADTALSTFLETYSSYAFGGLRTAADRSDAAEAAVRDLEKAARDQRNSLAHKEAEAASAEREQERLEAEERQAEESADALKQLPAFTRLQDLRTHERLVAEKRSSAVAALEAANRQRGAEDVAVDGVARALGRLADDLTSAHGSAVSLGEELVRIGLDPTPVTVPVLSTVDFSVREEEVRAKPDAGAPPLTVRRSVPPEVDVPDLAGPGERVAGIAAAARGHAALATALGERAGRVDEDDRRASSAERSASEAQDAAVDAAAERDRAQEDYVEAGRAWSTAVGTWLTTGPEVLDAAVPDAVDLDAARTVTAGARDRARPFTAKAGAEAHACAARCADLRAAVDAADADLAALRSGTERTPERTRFMSADRDPSSGAPFYRLVDFRPEVAESDRAGVEAALEACGLLDAWVTGTPDHACDVLAVPGPPVESSLAALLVPAVEPGSPVDEAVVAALLASVSIDSGTTAVSTSGRWSAGVLTGAWRKDAAEFLGAGARESARERRIAELEATLGQLRLDLGAAERDDAAARAAVVAWERHLDRFPADRDLAAGHALADSARRAAADRERRAADARAKARTLRAHAEATRADLERDAGDAGLPAGAESLRQAGHRATGVAADADRLADLLRHRCATAIGDLAEAAERHRVAVADRAEAEATADRRCADYASSAATVAELVEAVGGEAQEINDQLAKLDTRRRELRAALETERKRGVTTAAQVGRLSESVENTDRRLAAARADRDRAAAHFTDTIHAPGVLIAALPDVEADPAAVREALKTGRRAADEPKVLAKLQELQSTLAGTHEIGTGRHADLLTVTVTGEEGHRPVAVAAQRVTTLLARQRGFLDEQYQRIFADYLIRDLAEWLRGQIAVAEDLCARMNEILGRAKSSQGVHVKLAWKPSAKLDDATREGLALVRTPYAGRDQDQDATLRRVFTERIEAERDRHAGDYADILSSALDYRTWHQFTVTVADTGPDGKPRERRLRQLSSGETRLISYVTLFAAAASFYDAVGEEASPLRLVLLDEAFERLDDPTIARMLGLLVDLDMDWLITWPSGWGVSDRIPRMHIYDILRPKSGRGVACTKTTWDGAALDRVDP
ncbi:TIGR02680 family protein [Saccharothrix violaceirubra]|uniref:Uncharacterized protein (TIGR02680 family) n=1 Tax=Saccharothrix violaceirubra TaxID=413306 RepID=A0A7W7T8H0_9PSEU|nr:TIGR02680 family protein [Saccharothrix violaceirubra]MBB4968276.1 uncharacterized protein (TIGR02680 family) [Saccharothrix violaceirubra]